MTLVEQWMMDLILVYSVPSFLLGIGMTLLVQRWRRGRRARRCRSAMLGRDFLLEEFRLPRLFDNERLSGL